MLSALRPAAPASSEDDLLVEAQAGSETAFAALVQTHRSMVYSLAYHILQSRSRAEELAQDVFLALHQNLHRIESSSHLVFWLRRVTSNRCIDSVRRPWRRFEIPLLSVREPSGTPHERDPLLGDLLRRLVGELPPHRRTIVTLRFQEDLDPGEIARIIDMPVNTVKSHLRRAMAVLRRRLAERGYSNES